MSYSPLRPHEFPPKGSGGNTEYADTRTAFDDLPQSLKEDLKEKDYIAAHSLSHSRKVASPGYFKDTDPSDYPFGRHRLVQRHQPSGRMNLYIAVHAHHIEGLDTREPQGLFDSVYHHAKQPKYSTYSVLSGTITVT